MLGVFLLTSVINGYEAPKSPKHSIKKILGATGGWMGGFLIAHFFLNGLELSDAVWSSVLGAIAAIFVLFSIDMLMLWSKFNQTKTSGEDK
jgi:hypothetical protein